MGSPTGCLAEHELLAWVSGESASELPRAQLRDCPGCRSRLDRLRAELSEIRLAGPVSATTTPTPPSTTQPWPNGEPGPGGLNGQEPAASPTKGLP
jgi:hypothetical protein